MLRVPLLARRFSSLFSKLPDSEQALYEPSSKVVAFCADRSQWSLDGFQLTKKHFPNAFGFIWDKKDTSLSCEVANLPKTDRHRVYQQLVEGDFSKLQLMVSEEQCKDLYEGLMVIGGEDGKKIVSEAFSYLGVPPLVSYRNDLAFINRKKRVPLGWIVEQCPAAVNIHPGPPDKPGAGCYLPSLALQEETYGITVHHVDKNLDDGSIMFVKRFPIPKNSTYTQLRTLAAKHAEDCLEELLLRMKFADGMQDLLTTCNCHYTWGPVEYTKTLVRKMRREVIAQHGDNHPALH